MRKTKYTKRSVVSVLDEGESFYVDGKRHVVDRAAFHPDYYDPEWCVIDTWGDVFYESEFPPD